MSERIRVITEDQYKEYMELKKQVADATKKVRWKPKSGEDFWFIRDYGIVDSTYFYDVYSFDVMRYDTGNCFRTQEEAQKELDRKLAERELLDMCDWNGEEQVRVIIYDVKTNSFDWNWFYEITSPYRFASEESVKKAIDTLGEEKLKLIFRID